MPLQTRHLKSDLKKQNKPVYKCVPEEPLTADWLWSFFYPPASQSSNFSFLFSSTSAESVFPTCFPLHLLSFFFQSGFCQGVGGADREPGGQADPPERDPAWRQRPEGSGQPAREHGVARRPPQGLLRHLAANTGWVKCQRVEVVASLCGKFSHCRENWQDSMPTCLKTMTWKDSCIFRRLTI